MDGGRQNRLLSRLLGKLRGEHHRYSSLDKSFSITSTIISEGTARGSTTNDEDDLDTSVHPPTAVSPVTSNTPINEEQFAENLDLRYGGQYLTPQQLPEFCSQLHNLVEVIRNVQSYAKVTGEYPSELERRLDAEAREVAALAAEARNARDVVARTRAQRKAVRTQRKQLVSHLASLKETEVRELESTVRLSDRKLYKNWESLKNSTNLSVFDPLLDEIKTKQTALECLVQLIENRQSALVARGAPAPQPLPPPTSASPDTNQGPTTGTRRQEFGRRGSSKRRRKDTTREPHSMPLSGEPSLHESQPQITLFIEGTECTSRYRVGSAAATAGATVALAPLELSTRGSVRDIVFFTSI